MKDGFLSAGQIADVLLECDSEHDWRNTQQPMHMVRHRVAFHKHDALLLTQLTQHFAYFSALFAEDYFSPILW